MNLSEDSDYSNVVKRHYLNNYRRAISEIVVPVKQKQFIPDNKIIFLPVDEVIIESSDNLSNNPLTSEESSVSQHTEIRITSDENSVTISTKKMHPVEAWYRRTLPDYITCHQIWLVIHVLVTIALCVLYFTQIIQISAGTIAICELLLGVLVRNEIFIALLHRIIGLIPFFKYGFNRMLHCIGGIHVSSAISAFFWLIISLICEPHGLAVRITGGIILFFIISLSLTAMPIVRRRFHNTFEYIHRYVGWTSLITLVIHVVCLQLDKFDSFETEALFNVPVLILIVIIVIIFLPWICVRKVAVQFNQPSKDLTIMTFSGALYPYGSTTRISLDGHEWHAFAIALTDPCANQHSVLIAAVGDWTKDLARRYQENTLPEYVWIRQIKGLGFMYSIHAYRKVLIVCTGSGIAPALPYIKDPLPTTHSHLLWIAKKHEHNYGESIWKLVQKKYPHYTLHDTAVGERPSAQLVENYFWETDAQAVFVVSNEKFTNDVTNTLWRKGIPCFGALFDS